MKRIVEMAGVALALSLLAGCGSKENADTGPKTMEQAKQEASKLDRPEAGQYKQTIEITRFEIPGMPKEQADQMKGMMQNAQVQEFCLTPAQAEQGFKDMFDKVGEGGECKYSRFDVSGGRIDAKMDCASKEQGTATFLLAGTVGPKGTDITVDVDQNNPKSPMGTAKIGMHMKTERTGECAPAKP
ncbi:DUF3617 domain-containing protein [Novosphingobium album (ex Liu et al. 2023)]|uniref:DUF3617 domain-containing protein n=1 Tax=Novosphingobium album (ex Liu et al. 2023) TaxID=3031130 RepID=A0ABT5WJG1_9SPHN|nr:DUF3617 domain-containing protein [Novosphingobium album (ex Liu et al. 2023)]MDE8650185.1 DUF3617 domain-containing protein [Novosphingobium album (ex Liu et al. 2023)]